VLQSGISWEWGKVSNISRAGCYIETMRPLPTGIEAQLRLTIAGVPLEIRADVTFSNPMFGMGVNFIRTEQWNELTRFAKGRPRVRVAIAFKMVEKAMDGATSPAALRERHEDIQSH
jgi:hypothetical protein